MDIISNITVVSDLTLYPHKDVGVENGKIVSIKDHNGKGDTDYQSYYLVPGYIDIHTHGGCGSDVMDATPAALDAYTKFHLQNATTSILATTLTEPLSRLQCAIDNVREYRSKYAKILGVHMEGPFFSYANAGAQPREFLREGDEEGLEFIRKNSDVVKLISLAPDVKNISSVIETAKKCGLQVSLGHDQSIDDEIDSAIEKGACGVTHLGCCSSRISRREGSLVKHLGLLEKALLDNRLFSEVINDGMHIPKDLFLLFYKNKGAKKIIFVSDSLAVADADLSGGNFKLGSDVEVTVREGVAVIVGKNTLAGSITPVAKMVKRALSYGVPLAESVYMSAQSAADYLGLENVGRVKEGCDADFNIINERGDVVQTFLNGKKVG